MKYLLKKAYRGFFAGAEKRARQWSYQLDTWRKSIKGEIIEVKAITNYEGNIRFFLLKIDDKKGVE